jgi:signal transduction histidine kinase
VWSYRVALVALLLLWIVSTALLGTSALEQPPLAVRFASWLAVAWFAAGVGVLALLLVALARRRSAEAADAERFQSISAYLNEPIVICTAKGRIRWRNASAADLLPDARVLPDTMLALAARARDTRRIAFQTMSFGEGQRFSVQALPLDRAALALVFRPLNSESGRSTFYENFIRRIVHDMRNPLAGIIGHAANLRETPNVDDDMRRKSAATIEHEAQRLARLVDSMLFDARLAYVPLDVQTLDLTAVLEEAVYAHDEQAERQGKTLEMEAPPGTMRMQGDRDLLVRAFGNLIDNGLKYSREDGRLRVQLSADDDAYIIRFIDNGLGIPAEYLPDRIFEPLTRAHPHQSGSGLGLSIARKIFEMHGGSILAQSRVGEGTTMIVRLSKAGASAR